MRFLPKGSVHQRLFASPLPSFTALPREGHVVYKLKWGDVSYVGKHACAPIPRMTVTLHECTMDGEEALHIVFVKARSIRCTMEWEGIPASPTRTVPNFTYPPPMRGAAGPRATPYKTLSRR